MFRKSSVIILVISLILGFASFSSAESKITVLARDNGLRVGGDGGAVICVDGLKVMMTRSSTFQLYEEKNGKVVPVRCSNK